MDKKKLNDEIISCRGAVRRARVLVIRKILKKMKILKSCKNEALKEKKLKKSERLLEKIQIIKKLQEDEITKFALKNKDLEKFIKETSSNLKENAMACLAKHEAVVKKVENIREQIPNWETELPLLLDSFEKKNHGKNSKMENCDEQSVENILSEVQKTSEKVSKLKKTEGTCNEIVREAIEDQEESELEEVEKSRIENLENNKTKNLEKSKIEEQENNKVKKLENNKIKNLENNKSKNLENSKIKNLKNSKIKKVDKSKIEEQENNKIKNLENNKIKNLENNKIKNLENNKIKNLENNKSKNLENSKIKNLKNSKIKKLENNKIEEQENNKTEKELNTNFENSKSEEMSEGSEEEELPLPIKEEKIDDPFFIAKKVIAPKPLPKFPPKDNVERKRFHPEDSSFMFRAKPFKVKKESRFSNSIKTPAVEDEKLHPSWAAKKVQLIRPFEGKKIKFSD